VIVTDNIERQKTKVLKVRAFINFEDMSYDLTKSLEPVYNDVAFESYLRKI